PLRLTRLGVRSCMSLLAVPACFAACGGEGASGGQKESVGTMSQRDVAGSITLNQSSYTGGYLNQNFVGLSYEKNHMTIKDALSSNNSNNAIANLMNNMGGGTLRIGAYNVDTVTYSASQAQVTSGTLPTHIGTAAVNQLASLVGATNWPVIYGLNVVTEN